ncbi:hypothetical protein [Yersinia hibernica]|uniref:hypothetical protein n=1 Tax=Yersinia hibernica TaxID=2339259 RepID=UPI0011A64E75|nr:hypothetical protein [Yersinia hibernica]
MAYKLNQKIKTHIADMATRNKHKAAFDKAFVAFKEDAYQQLYKKYQNELFEGVSPVVLETCDKTDRIDLCSDRIDVSAISTAMQLHSDKLEQFGIGRYVYGKSYAFYANDLSDKTALKKLMTTVRLIIQFRSDLLSAMAHFKSGEKMVSALPWTDKFYPEEDKTPTCNIVPVSVIEKANSLMGIKANPSN